MKLDIRWFDVIDSTNNEALRSIDSADDISVFASFFQTQGRGQKGNKWESTKGENLTFSILIKPVFISAVDQFIVSQIVTISLKKYLQTKGIDIKIKWPNDIYFGNKKICGILIENHFSDVNLSASIIGIGLNMNQTQFGPDLLNPTSLKLITGESYDLKAELVRFVEIFKDYYEYISKGGVTDIITNEYKESLYQLNELCRYEDLKRGKIFTGIIRGVDKNACLIVENEEGGMVSFAFKELKYLISQ